MRFISLLLTSLLTAIFSGAQNLVPNPSFEDVNYCEANIPCSPAAWFSVSNIPYGYQNNLPQSYDGKHSIAFLVAFEQEIRSYWQTPVLCDLQAGEQYNIRFDVNVPAGKFDPLYFGIFLSDKIYHSQDDTLIRIDDSITLTGETIKKLQHGWSEIMVPFMATGNEKYLLMGNFNKSSNKEILKSAGINKRFIEYYIDNISLSPADKNAGTCPEYKFRKDSLYAISKRHVFVKIQLSDSLAANKFPVMTSATDTIVLGKINFNFDSEKLKDTGKIKNYFNGTDISNIDKIEIKGYSDSIGSKSYNLKLSEKRAISVKEYLIKFMKVPIGLIEVSGKGIVKDNINLEANRRVELIIFKKR